MMQNWKWRNAKWHVYVKPKKTKCESHKNLATVVNCNLKKGKMGDTKPSDNMLDKTKHTRSIILIYIFGLYPVPTPYLVG